MAEAAAPDARMALASDAPPHKKGGGKKLLLLAVPVLLLGGGAAAYFMVPGVAEQVSSLTASKSAAADGVAAPIYVDVPEITVTLPNAGRARQLRVKLTLELAKLDPEQKPADILTPRVYDSLVTYLRTLRDAEVDGAIAIDRLRGDLFRRLDLLLGQGVLKDVLVTGMVVA
jgi:flagellar FliL protein